MNPSTNTPRFSFVLPPSRLKRWLAAISAVLLTTLGAGAVAPAAQAASKEASATVFSVPGWDYANVRSGPSTDKSTVKTIPAGSEVTLGCSTRGGNATGPYGSSDLWYKVAGTDTYIADVMILTGSDEAVTEACGETKPEPKPSAPAQNYNREAAVQWAKAHVYDAERFPYVNGNGGDCTWFLSQALWAGGLPKFSAWTPDNAPFSLKPPRTATGADYLKNHLVTDTGGRQSRWVRVSELVSRGGVLLGRGRGPRRDDEWCLINPFVLGARADVIFHHERLVAPASGPGSQERHRPPGQAGCAS